MATNLTPNEVLQRADLALSDLTSGGGTLPPEVADRFIDEIYDATPIFSMATREKMASFQKKIPRLGFTSQILMASPGDNTALASGERSKPTTYQVTLDAKEYVGQVNLPYTVLEDNVEKENFQTKLLQHIAKQVSIDLAKAAYHGDTTLGAGTNENNLLRVQDGWFKRASSHVVDVASANIDETVLARFYKAMPDKYISQDVSSYTMFLQREVALDWRSQVAGRMTIEGDRALVENAIPPYAGVPVVKDNVIKKTAGLTQGLFCDPKNLIIGTWRQITLEAQRDIEKRQIKIVFSLRVAFNLFQPDALVRMDNVAPVI